ncbi:hypothetical protein ACFVHA_28955, partial [Bacillus cereus]|uniref:hypothetical protein n=1 Tax=Bacillus cereus TaxID=1396 RepID=UPI00362F8B30
MAEEIGVGYVTIMPSMRGFRRDTNREFRNVEKDAHASGERTGRSMASGFFRGFRAGGNVEREGQNAGQRYGRGFLSGVRTGLRGMVAAFTVVNAGTTSIIRNVGRIATITGLAARIVRGFSLSVMAGATALHVMAGASLGKLAG